MGRIDLKKSLVTSSKAVLVGAIIAGLLLCAWFVKEVVGRKEPESGPVGMVTERVVDGRRELCTKWSGLVYEGSPPLEWCTAMSHDSSDESFTLMLRSATQFLDKQEKRPLATVEAPRTQLNWLRIASEPDGEGWWVATAAGTRADLTAIANAKFAVVRVGDHSYGFDSQGMANCRELLRRTEAAHRP